MKVTLDGVEYDTDQIPELSAEELAEIMGEVAHIDEATERVLSILEAKE